MKKMLIVLKVVFVVFIFYWIVSKYDINTAKQIMASSKPLWGIIAIAISGMVGILYAFRWSFVIKSFWENTRVRIWDLYRIGLLSSFYMLFMPTTIVGEAVKLFKINKILSESYMNVGTTIVIDRLVGLCLWFVFFIGLQSKLKYRGTVIIVFSVLIIFVFVFRGRLKNYKEKLLGFVKYHPKYLTKAIVFSIIGQFGYIVVNYMVFRCFDFNINFVDTAVLASTGVIAGLIPISVLGIGPRDGLYLTILPNYGASHTQSIFIISALVFIGYFFAIIGGLIELIYDGFVFSKLKIDSEELEKISRVEK